MHKYMLVYGRLTAPRNMIINIHRNAESTSRWNTTEHIWKTHKPIIDCMLAGYFM